MTSRMNAVVGCLSVLATLSISGWAEAGAVLAVRAKAGEAFDETVVDRVKAVPHVIKIERVLFVEAQPNPVIGVEPGTAVRIPGRDGKPLEAKIETGRALKEGDKNLALTGLTVYREQYGFKAMGGMMHGHPFEPGASFTLPGSQERIRVAGTFSVEPESEGQRVVLPLATAQRFFGAAGKVTHLFVEVDQAEHLAEVRDAITKVVRERADVISP